MWNQLSKVCVTVCVFGACANSVPAPSPTVQESQTATTDKPGGLPTILSVITLEPGDLLSSTGETPIRAVVNFVTLDVDDKILQDVAASLVLTELDSKKAVPFSTQVFKPTDGNTKRVFVVVTPVQPIAAVWHVLSLTNLPPKFKFGGVPASDPTIGKYAVRFNPASRPTLTAIVKCDKGASVSSVIVSFSENIQSAKSTGESLVSLDQPSTGKQCDLIPAGPKGSSGISFSCNGFAASPWQFKLKPGLLGASGAGATTLDGKPSLTMDVDWEKIPVLGNGCQGLRF